MNELFRLRLSDTLRDDVNRVANSMRAYLEALT